MFTTLIEPQELAELTRSADCAIIDCRFELQNPAWGAEQYAAAHISGALYAHLDRDLSAAVGPDTGRHPLPDPQALAATLSRWGVDSSQQIVAYDQGSGAYAARLWWLARWLGASRVAVLNGGFAAWCAAGLPTTRAATPRAPKRFIAKPQPAAFLSCAEVEHSLAVASIRLVDARAADRFAGENETIDPVAGHVPGAVSAPFTGNLGADGRFLSKDALRARWTPLLAGRPSAELVMMCGSGVTACHNLLALEHAGYNGARLFAGSWSEWIRDPRRPVARGAA